jgi:hypothetical protein
MEMQERLHRALDILAGDEGSEPIDLVLTDEAKRFALSDCEVLEHAHGLVDDYVDNDELADAFYFVLDEIGERFAPDVERERLVRWRAEGAEGHTGADPQAELAADLEGIEQRAAQRKAARDAS